MSDDAYAQENGHPPVAANVVCVDFDQTIIPWGPLMEPREPFRGARDAIRRLKAEGFRVFILTSRASPSWWRSEAEARGVNADDFGREQIGYVKGILDTYGVPYDQITSEKVPALAYFDDSAWRVAPAPWSLLAAVDTFIRGRKA